MTRARCRYRAADVEWRLVRPAFWAWMFIGLTDLLAARYGDARRDAAPPTLEWQVRHLRLHSPLLATKAGVPTRNG
ncbi:hypothetical protein [Micromonospora globbae]|uniref:hypothetical protein n=1 Tax=Micromonospora globbae TaxID=1894969 RepID=UPI003434A99B